MVGVTLAGTDIDSDPSYSPAATSAPALTVHLSSLPTRGDLYVGADTLGGGACDSNADGAISFDATVTADQLPLTLCGGRVWYLPPPDAYSRPADAAVGSFEYYVRDGTQRSPPATVSVVATPIDDPPTATPFTIEAYDGVPAAFSLHADDIDSAVASTVVTRLPSRGTLYFRDHGWGSTAATPGAPHP